MAKQEWLNVPNLLTILRFILNIVFVCMFFVPGLYYWSLLPFLLAGFTDILDGAIARKYNLITGFGKAMDPVADKLLIFSVIVCLTIAGNIPLWVLIVVGAKELLMILGGLLIYKKTEFVVFSNWFGKLAAAFIFFAVLLCFFHEYLAPWDWIVLYVGVGLTLISLGQYAYFSLIKPRQNRRKLDQNS